MTDKPYKPYYPGTHQWNADVLLLNKEKEMNTMLDLRSMSDDEFTVLVTPTVPQTTMRVTVEESGKILLSSKVAAKLS